MEYSAALQNPVLHVVVVGFHHKKGCQVEYSYPPLIEGKTVDSNECPEEWRHLPSLALPDGAHNYLEDTVYFLLPSRTESKSAIYGVSCYRQIDSTELLNRGTDVTRNTVQKSVCVLSRLPVFGLVQAKLQLITHAYFKSRDFSQVSLLEETYKTLNLSLTDSLLQDSQVFLGLSCRDLLHQFQHRLLVLFKLMLLERRVLFYSSPVKPICTSLLTVVSLFPGLIEHGLKEAAGYSFKQQNSSTLQVIECDDYLSVQYEDAKESLFAVTPSQKELQSDSVLRDDHLIAFEKKDHNNEIRISQNGKLLAQSTFYVDMPTDFSAPPGDQHLETSRPNPPAHSITVDNEKSGIFGSCPRSSTRTSRKPDEMHDSMNGPVSSDENFSVTDSNLEDLLEKDDELTWETDKLLLEISEALDDNYYVSSASPLTEPSAAGVHSTDLFNSEDNESKDLSKSAEIKPAVNDMIASRAKSAITQRCQLTGNGNTVSSAVIKAGSSSSLVIDEFGFPLAVFTKGVLCHPYLSLHLYDILNDVNVRGFVIGATNALFQQKTSLTDVVVELSDLRIDIHDPELKKQLSLSTADLRFAEHLVRSISNDKGDIYLVDTEWEGGDDWLRSQFKSYLLSLLSTVSHGDERMIEDFNSSFTAAWKATHNYKQWKSCSHPGILQIPPEHPFHGQLSISDVRMKINQVIQQADRNKKINAVVNQTGKVVSQTGKVVGDAFSSAKSVMTTWFGSIGASKT